MSQALTKERFVNSTVKLPKNLLKTLLLSTTILGVSMQSALADAEGPIGVKEVGGAEGGVTLIYGEEFFEQYPSAVNAVDLVERIPGGRNILGEGGGNQRGFSANKDAVLVNGRRVTGKGNDSRSVLSRITVEQVEKIELIRGNSPDIKAAGQSAVINVVTRSDVSSGSGTYRAAMAITDQGYVSPGATLTYGSQAGKLEYFMTAEWKSESRDPVQNDKFYDANDQLLSEIDFDIDNRKNDRKLSANFSYMLENGNPIRLNAGYRDGPFNHYRYGDEFTVNQLGDLEQVAQAFRKEYFNEPSWEIGGDYEGQLGGDWTYKVIGLYASKDFTFDQYEDYNWDGETVHEAFRSDYNRKSTESIGRLSFKYGAIEKHNVEIGSEFAVNTMDTLLVYKERNENDVLELVDVDGDIVGVSEQRMESFINDTWSVTPKTTVEGALTSEYSKITVDNAPNAGRSLFYLKPTLDIRHNLDNQNQIQITFLRQVSQLNFSQFASSVNGDNQVDGGNNELNPWKAWKTKWGFEHRLDNDGGTINLTIFTGHFQGMHGPFEVSPGVTGTANIGKAEEYGLKYKASLRLDKIGMKDAVLALNGHIGRAKVSNTFTGEKVAAPWLPEHTMRLNLRHDIKEWGISYEVNAFFNARQTSWRYDEYIVPPGNNFNFWGSVQKQISSGMFVRLGAGPALVNDEGRTRMIYAAGIAEGTLTSKEVRKRFNGRRVRISLHGTF